MKNAVLITAHDHFQQLENLILSLDHESVDIFIHINKKINMPNIEKLTKNIKFSNVFFIENRVSIMWGGPGILYAEIELLKSSVEKYSYDYYHFISGQDLPIKSVDYINDFLEQNLKNNNSKLQHTNYIVADIAPKEFLPRIEQYNFFIRHYRDKNVFLRYFYRGVNKILRYFQKALKINRMKNNEFELFFGSTWWSISNEFANYVISNETKLKELFNKYTFAADEFAIQTLIKNSNFKDSIYNPKTINIERNLRLIDFTNGNGLGSPHIFLNEDFYILRNSQNLFARKFNDEIDNDIIERVISNNIVKEVEK